MATSTTDLFPDSHLPKVDALKLYDRVSNRYVAWVDMMGAGAAMGRSLQHASTAITKIHAAMIETCSADVSFLHNADVYPVIDGVYIVTEDRDVLEMLLAESMHRLASIFMREPRNELRFLIRGGIAAGRLVTGTALSKSCKTLEKEKHYSRCLAIGSAIGQAYRAESSAPPFGLYVDITARSFVVKEEQPFLGVLWRWWDHKSIKKGKEIRDALGKELLKYYGWIVANRQACEYDVKRIEEHRKSATEYFQLPSE